MKEQIPMNYTIVINGQKWIIASGTLCQAIQAAKLIKETEE